jgi:1-acyl-sn-glycerol-3-phosphate acyltransferase
LNKLDITYISIFKGLNQDMLIFRILLFLARLVYPDHMVKGTDNVREKGPAVFVSNHSGIYGPVVMQLFFTYRYRPWVIYEAVSPQHCRKYLEISFLKRESGISEPYNRWLAWIIAPVCIRIMQGVKAIPVYRSYRVLKTFAESIKSLENEYNLVIFPEDYHTKGGKYVKQFYSGFIYTAKEYYHKTGKQLLFYPVYSSYRKKTITIGRPIRYLPENGFKKERVRISTYLQNTMDNIALQINKD